MRGKISKADKTIAANLRIQRTRAGLSQEALGQAVGVTFQQIQKYEKALNRITAGRLFELSQALKVDIDVFFAGLTVDH